MVSTKNVGHVVDELQQVMGELVVRGKYRDIAELSIIIENLPALLKHRSYLVRADAYDFIAAYGLMQFAKAVHKGCSDRNPIARTYAMGAYYDLLGKEAISFLKRFLGSRETRVRLEALCVLYIELREDEYLNEIERIVTRKNCSDYNRSLVVSEFEAHLPLRDYPEILSLFEHMLSILDKERGLAKDLRKLLKNAGNDAREHKSNRGD